MNRSAKNKRSLWFVLICLTMIAGGWQTQGAYAAIPGVSVQKYIMVDQFGYRPGDDKVAVLVDPQSGYNAGDSYTPGSTFQVRRASDDIVVFTGTPIVWNQGTTQSSSGDKGWWFDFSSVTAEGEYYVYDVEGNYKSYNFIIADDVYKDILKAAIRTFYYQRIGTPHLAQHAGAAFADTAAFVGPHQDTQARNVFDRSNAATERDLSGGWMDAGDYNKYVTFTAQPINELLSAYDQNPEIFTDDYNIPESGNGIPDVLDEVKWELDWLKKMQESDGGVLMKVGFPSTGGTGDFGNPPSTITRDRYYLPKTSASTIITALNFAHAALIFKEIPSLQSYADDLETRAIQAWNWYQSNPKTDNADQGEIEAGDADVSLQGQAQAAAVASAYMYALTGDTVYHTYFINNYQTVFAMTDGNWGMYYGEQAEALMFYTTLTNADPTVKADILSKRDLNDSDQTFVDTEDLYRSYVQDWAYHWGSLQVRARLGASAYDFVQYNINPLKKDSANKKAQNILHYFHGVNPLGAVYLTNMGEYGAEHSITQIYHSWYADGSQWDMAPPGYVPGGPSTQYSGTESPPLGQPLQKMYKDWNGIAWEWPNHVDASWEITENAIYYQSGYIKLLAKFVKATVPTQPPGIPAGLTAAAAGATSINVNWNMSAGATTYDIEVDGVIHNNGSEISYSHTGLTQGTTHTYRVRATNSVGTSAWSSPVTAVTDVPPLPPEVPAALTASAPSSFSIDVSWAAAARATSYELEVDGTVVDVGTQTSYAHTGIASSSTHHYRVRSKNSSGSSAWSVLVSVTTPQAPQTSVIDISHNGTQGYSFGQSSDQVKRYQTFIAGAYSTLTGIDVKIRKAGLPGNVTVGVYATSGNKPTGSALATATIAAGSVTEDYAVVSAALQYNDLQNGQKYAIVLGQTSPGVGSYEWLAGTNVNSNLEFGKYTGSAYVDESSIGDGWTKLYVELSQTPEDPPEIPAALTALATSSFSIDVSWAAAARATYYELEVDGTVVNVGTQTSYAHTGIASSSTHNYRVRSKNSAGTSAWSTLVSATTPQAPQNDVIDISHNGTQGYLFGQSSDQVKRYQTFIAGAYSTLTGIDVKIRKAGLPGNVTVDVYATSGNKPTGSALATATIAAGSVTEDYAVVSAALSFSGLQNGQKYAIVLGQTSPGVGSYEWLAGTNVNSNFAFGKYTGSTYVDESSIGDGWTKLYVQS